MSFPRYQSYKDSGVEWLGEVPGHWEVKRLSYVTEILAGHSFDAALFGFDGVPVIRMSDFGDGQVNLDDAKRVEPLHVPDRSLAQSGDVLLGLSGSISNFAIVREQDIPIAINQRVAMVRIHDSKSSMVKWFLQSAEFSNQLVSVLPETTIQNISMGQLRGCNLPFPPPPEQTQIAAFLDRETAKIDELVAEQQRLMELLKEKRQAVISHAVTKGLNPDTPMKPSGIEWLGDVPEHWEVKPLRRLISKPLSNGIFKKKDDFGRGTRLVNVFDIYQSDFKIKPDELERVDCTSDEIANYKVDAGDLFFVRSSLKQSGIAVVAVAEPYAEELVFECHLIRARPKAALLNPRYSSFLLNSAIYRATLIAKAKMTTMTTIDQEAILSLALSVPPLTEQVAIATFLDTETAKFDTLTAEAQRAIDLLQERRTALISAAVTGQIDVRPH